MDHTRMSRPSHLPAERSSQRGSRIRSSRIRPVIVTIGLISMLLTLALLLRSIQLFRDRAVSLGLAAAVYAYTVVNRSVPYYVHGLPSDLRVL